MVTGVLGVCRLALFSQIAVLWDERAIPCPQVMEPCEVRMHAGVNWLQVAQQVDLSGKLSHLLPIEDSLHEDNDKWGLLLTLPGCM